MDRLTVAEKKIVLMQIMACVGSCPMPLECIAHDCGLSVIETACLLVHIVKEHPEIKLCKKGFYYIDED